MQLSQLEESLLQELANSEGDILENKNLINSLNQTKTQSLSIAQALDHAQEVQADLDRQREVYRDIASKGSILFFLVKQV